MGNAMVVGRLVMVILLGSVTREWIDAMAKGEGVGVDNDNEDDDGAIVGRGSTNLLWSGRHSKASLSALLHWASSPWTWYSICLAELALLGLVICSPWPGYLLSLTPWPRYSSLLIDLVILLLDRLTSSLSYLLTSTGTQN